MPPQGSFIEWPLVKLLDWCGEYEPNVTGPTIAETPHSRPDVR